MWLFTPNAFVSVVAHRDRPAMLMVRARYAEDLRRMFPGSKVQHTPEADYPFRTTVSRSRMARVMVEYVRTMDYDNVKGAIGEGEDHRYLAMNRVWAVMNDSGRERLREEGLMPKPRDARQGDMWGAH